jgi:hypothetical protein
LDLGYDVKVFTARVSVEDERTKENIIDAIHTWLTKQAGLPILEVTNVKDFKMVELWDDRCVGVKANTGRFLSRSSLGIE